MGAALCGGGSPNFCQNVAQDARHLFTTIESCFRIGGGVLRGSQRPRAELLAMRYRLPILVAFLFALAAPASADAPKDIKGLFLLTDYPAVTVQPGTASTISLKLRNYDLAPERLALSVSGVPAGWTATLLGGGQPIAAAMPATDDSVLLDLRLDVPKDAAI